MAPDEPTGEANPPCPLAESEDSACTNTDGRTTRPSVRHEPGEWRCVVCGIHFATNGVATTILGP